MAEPRVEENKLGKYLVFDDRKTSLQDIIEAAFRYFPGIDHNEIYFEVPDYYGCAVYNDLRLSNLPKSHFIKYEDGNVGTKIYPYRTLSQVIKTAKSSSDCRGDLSNVRLLWNNGELCMHVGVDKIGPVICGTISTPQTT